MQKADESPLSALERQMGVAKDAMDIDIGTPTSLPDDDEDATPPGRSAVSYARTGDGLFSPATPVAASDAGDGEKNAADAGGLDNLTGGLMDLLGDPASALDGGGMAVIAQLEAMADEFERQSGEPEVEIRAKIAMLRSVLDARPGAVAQSRVHMDTAVAALDDGAAEQAAGGAGCEHALNAVCATTVERIEHDLSRVEATLQADPAAAAMVSTLLHPPPPGRQ